MKAKGILFLNRTRPVASTTPAGEFQLVLSALHRISERQAELWQVRYIGQAAKALWDLAPREFRTWSKAGAK